MKRTPLKRGNKQMKRTPISRVGKSKAIKKIKKPKKKTTSQLKKELDKIFSLYIRNKYAKNGQVKCYTCTAIKGILEIQNGHFVSRSHLSTRFSEDNVRPQCVGCNVFGGGKVSIFAINLDKELGEGTSMRLYKEAQEITKYYPYEEKIKEYKEKLSQYANEKN
jgi:hypothetical protein